MRATHTLGLALLVLLLAGCINTKMQRTGGGGGGMASNAPVDPFILSSRDGTAGRDPVNGILAGYTLDRWRTPLADATIEILDLNEPPSGGKRAHITTTADRNGQYKFEGLNSTHQYQLVARTREGNRALMGTVLGTPPNPRLPIFLTEDRTGPDPRSAAKDEDKNDTKTATQSRERTNTIAGPSATLAPPIKNSIDSDNPTPPAAPTNSVPPAQPAPETDRSHSTQGGFLHDPIITIPGPGTVPPTIVPPPPSAPPAPTPAIPIPPPAGSHASLSVPPGPSPTLPEIPATVPSCNLIGRKLANFALYDLEGRPWIYSRDRDRNARVVVLDFWFSSCGPCRQSIPVLCGFQKAYGPHGLQIIGIANEDAPRAEAVRNVRGVRGRYNVNYTTLLAGGGSGPCPVLAQFEVQRFPTLVVLDETGTIVWRKVGSFNEQSRQELDLLLRKKLGIR